MKRSLHIALVVLGATMLQRTAALDAVQNDFWDTTGHVETAPVAQDGTMSGTFYDGLSAAAATIPTQGFDSWAYSIAFAAFEASKTFNSYKPIGLVIKFR